MKSVSAFAPANISLIFKPHKGETSRWSGSLGLGFTLLEGVVVTVKNSKKTETLFNRKKIDIQTVFDVLRALTNENLLITIETKFPLGCGFGISGASALATAYAINKLLALKKSKRELAIIAHTQEVKNKTGLGDVTNQFFGGALLKIKPSSYFSVRKITLKEKVVFCRVFSPLSTKSILSNNKVISRVKTAATKALVNIGNELRKKNTLTLGDIFSISKQFVTESGLLMDRDVKNTIEQIEKRRGKASMIILGNAVVSETSFPGSTKFFLSDKGATLL
ncbi:MAG: hypothetical protein HYV39_03170 [Candidatus Levybacteria bacterium]|nr:hypothetical protein [Candidatus Levybacteria bacterium]